MVEVLFRWVVGGWVWEFVRRGFVLGGWVRVRLGEGGGWLGLGRGGCVGVGVLLGFLGEVFGFWWFGGVFCFVGLVGVGVVGGLCGFWLGWFRVGCLEGVWFVSLVACEVVVWVWLGLGEGLWCWRV